MMTQWLICDGDGDDGSVASGTRSFAEDSSY